jgi:hypothetical protein
MSSLSNPAAALAAAEQSLVAAVNQLAAALSGVASGPLDAALIGLKREAEAARDRIAGAREFAALMVSDVLASLAGLTADLSPEPAALPQPPAEEPAIELGEETVVGEPPTTQPWHCPECRTPYAVPSQGLAEAWGVTCERCFAGETPGFLKGTHVLLEKGEPPAREWPEASLPPEGPLTRAALDAGRGATATATPSPNGRKPRSRR